MSVVGCFLQLPLSTRSYFTSFQFERLAIRNHMFWYSNSVDMTKQLQRNHCIDLPQVLSIKPKISLEECQNCPLIWMSQLNAIIALHRFSYDIVALFNDIRTLCVCKGMLEWNMPDYGESSWIFTLQFALCALRVYDSRYFPPRQYFSMCNYIVPDVTFEWIR